MCSQMYDHIVIFAICEAMLGLTQNLMSHFVQSQISAKQEYSICTYTTNQTVSNIEHTLRPAKVLMGWRQTHH